MLAFTGRLLGKGSPGGMEGRKKDEGRMQKREGERVLATDGTDGTDQGKGTLICAISAIRG